MPVFENLNCFGTATTNSTNLLHCAAVVICLNLDYFVTTNKVTISSNRKLLEILGVSRLAANETNNCDVGNLTFSTLLNNITECKYLDIPNSKILSSTDNGITFLHINLRSINNQENFDKFYKFLTFTFPTRYSVCIRNTVKGDPLINICLPNYSFVHADSLTNASGVSIYISSKFQFEVDPTLKIKTNG